MLETLLNLFENYKNTCPINKLRTKCVTFARDVAHLTYLNGKQKDVWVITPDIRTPSSSSNGIKYYPMEYPEYWFTMYHNHVNKNYSGKIASIGYNSDIHKTVLIGVEGLKVVNAPNGFKVQFVHTGKVDIEDSVSIGPYSVIHRGTMSNTTIRNGCKFGAYTNIGHNCDIGRNTIMAAGVVLNGGVKVGKNCWFASRSTVRHHVNICDDVVIGLGSVVLKDITEPGIYVGNPARYLKPITKGWNF